MDIDFIKNKLDEIAKELEKEVMEIIMDENLDKKEKNLKMKPLVSTKKILSNAFDSIKMVNNLSRSKSKKQND